jgi:hypothetical protein
MRSACSADVACACCPRPRQLEAKLEEVRKSVKADLDLRGAQEGPLGFDATLLGAGATLLSAAGDHDDDRGPGGRPKRRR